MEKGSKTALRGFLSHTSTDKKFVRKLANDLQSQGIDIWLDEWFIKGGESLSSKIQEGIETSDVFILVLSKEALESEWVKEELRAAYQLRFNKRDDFLIIPTIIDDEISQDDIPLFLRDYYYISFQKNNYSKALNKLSDSIIFNQNFIKKYQNTYQGGFIINSINVITKISGSNQEIVEFEENYKILPTKKISKINKSFEHDGEIVSADLLNGTLKRERLRKSTEKWNLKFPDALLPQKESVFKLRYKLKNEFHIARNWYYSIDAPTRLFEFQFFFHKECSPERMVVDSMQTQTKIDEEMLTPHSTNDGVKYLYRKPFPGYKDWFQFHWT